MLATYKRYTPIFSAWSAETEVIPNPTGVDYSAVTGGTYGYGGYTWDGSQYSWTTTMNLYTAVPRTIGISLSNGSYTDRYVVMDYVFYNAAQGNKQWLIQKQYHRYRTAAKGAFVDTVQLEYSSSIPTSGLRNSDGYWYEIQDAVTYKKHYNKMVNFRNPTGWVYQDQPNSTGRTGMSSDSFTFDNTNGFMNTGTVEYKELETNANIYYYSSNKGWRWERVSRNGDPVYKYWNFNQYIKTCQYDEIQGDYYQDVIAPLGQFTIGVKNADGYWYVLETGAKIWANVGGVWKKSADSGKVNIDGQWKTVNGIWVNVDGIWKKS